MLQFSVLASGSSGNSVYIRSDETALLLDAGISGKQIQQRLAEAASASLSSIDAVLVTHEHVDHVRGLKQVMKLSGGSLYITEGTWHHVQKQLEDVCTKDDRRFVKADESFVIGDIRVTPFTVSHDAEEPVAYRFDAGEDSLAVVTDLGYVSDHIKGIIRGCGTYVWEANHDVDMLRAGRYPWSVKRRILGDKGHLSNEDSAVALADLLENREVDVFLAHLSEENNQPDLAELTVTSILREMSATFAEQVRLHRTARHTATALRSIGSV
ncbi:MBL fold hydrolase [Alicyclobacillus contaminans]|uniref:MBL fold metallo-hydrolase n=1 Tax=Alicyclobacillus contaminans TaxID=392016 RepID=UPI0004124E8F|nr:MBL fold metallo-hydrolase [Alicyclobacillus contaminans]GMA50780.1 MBL fold hydrolase [Alicyclobacillus contaminans]